MFQTIGKYQILRLLGKGSMGEVYLGHDPVLDRQVAIKTIQAGSNFEAEGEARFRREAQAMAALNHPHIITLFDFGKVDDLHYLAMEYLDGSDLAVLIQDNRLGRPRLLEALAQACEGLGYAHRHGIVHRDVKPGNILVATEGETVRAKLLDFGVASVDRSSLTQQGVWMGTVGYMAPEYLDSGKATASSDLFAVGAIIYEILSGGRKPFPGESTTAILNAILRRPAEPLSPAELEGVSPRLVAVMEQALAKDPTQRFSDAETLAAALREALTDPLPPPLTAVPPPALVVGKGSGAQCLSLRVAVRQARPGTVITLLPGLYKEAVQLDKSLTIQGVGDPAEIILEAPAGPSLTVAAPDCAVRGFTLQRRDDGPAVDLRSGHTRLEASTLAGLRVGPGAGAALEECAVSATGNLPAVLLEAGATLRARASTFTHPTGLGLRLEAKAEVIGEDLVFEDTLAGAVELGAGSSAQFLRCDFLRSGFAGVLAFQDAQAHLEGCRFSGHAGAGVHGTGARLTLTGCRILENGGMGVSLTDGGTAQLVDCDVVGNGQPGLLLHRGAAARVTQCRLEAGRSLGIACHQGAALVLEHSIVRGNALGGVLLGPGAQEPEWQGNNLADPVLGPTP